MLQIEVIVPHHYHERLIVLTFRSYCTHLGTSATTHSLTIFVMCLVSGFALQTGGYAQSNSASYTSPVIKASYTLVFTARVEKPTQQWLTHIGRKNLMKPGKITISSNGRKTLYLAQFGSWRSVAVFDVSNGNAYSYDSYIYNAIVSTGIDNALESMWLLPMPGVGYDIYPMFHSFRYSKTGMSHGRMAVLGAVASETNGVIKDMSYRDADIIMTTWKGHSVVSSCKIMMPIKLPLVEESWAFSGYRNFGSLAVAGSISRITSVPAVSGQWPPRAMKIEGEIHYTLNSLSQTSLPSRQYDLENYLPNGYAITDYRRHL